MKKLLALVLALMMILGATSALADDDLDLIDIRFSSAVEDDLAANPTKWLANGENRALLTVLMYADYCLYSGKDTDEFALDNTYVGYSADTNTVNILLDYVDGSCVCLICTATTDMMATYIEADLDTSVLANSADLADYNFKKNTDDDMNYGFTKGVEILQAAD